MPALGEEFRSAREARGLSLSDVAERLHIRSVYLAAIEDEDWRAIGAPVYVRGFMRTYARFLGLDAEDAVARFAAVAPAAPGTAAPRVDERPRERGAARDRSSPSIVAILAVLVAIGVVAYVSYAYVQYRTGNGAPLAAVSAPPDASEAPVSEASPKAPAEAAPVPLVARPATKRGIHVSVTQTSWLRVAIDGTVVAEGTYPAGTAKSFTGHVADVRVGNAGGVAVIVDGRPVGKLGHSGDVVERRFVLSGE